MHSMLHRDFTSVLKLRRNEALNNYPHLFIIVSLFFGMELWTLWNSFLLLFSKKWDVSDVEYAAMPPVFHIDDYDNCLLYGKEALFCGIAFLLSPRNLENASEVWETINKLKNAKRYWSHDVLLHGVCVTTQCPNIEVTKLPNNNISLEDVVFIKELEECYNHKFIDLDLKGEIKGIRCESQESPYNFNMFDFLFCVFLVTFIALVLYAWIYDIVWKPNFKDQNFTKTIFGKYISSFSLSQNWHRLVTVDLKDPDIKSLSSIQGVRFFNLAGVIIGHSSLWTILAPVQNIRFLEANVEHKFEQFIGTGGRLTTLQTFFLVSNFLHAWKFFDECEGKKTVTVSYLVRSFFSRYFRLTPMVALVSIFFGTVMPHLGRGPTWEYLIGDGYRICRRNWWYNLLYINNFIPLSEMCLGHLWSLSIDIQFYAFALVVLWLMWNYENRIILIIGSLMAYHVVQTFFSYHKRFILKIDETNSHIDNATIEKMQEIFILYKSMTVNMAAFSSGLAFGYLFYKFRNKQVFRKKVHITLWWILSWGAMGTSVIFPGFFFNFLLDSPYVDLIMACYMAISKCIFAFGVGLFIFGMTQGHGHIIRTMCEWPVIYILGRINYNAYLFHVIIQRFVIGLKRTPNYLSHYILIFDSFSYLAVSYMAAALLTLFFEYPFAEMKKHISNALKKKNLKESDKKLE